MELPGLVPPQALVLEAEKPHGRAQDQDDPERRPLTSGLEPRHAGIVIL